MTLRRQERSAKTLGEMLRGMQAITETEIDGFMEAKIDETIYGLFDADGGVFRFEADSITDPYSVTVDLAIPDVLERGLQRSEERRRLRKVIRDRGIVLRRRGRPEPPWLSDDRAATRIFDLIDGNRTVADLLLQSHALEFQVDRLLTRLLENGLVEIATTRPEATSTEPPLDDPEVRQAIEAVKGLKARAETALSTPKRKDAAVQKSRPQRAKRQYRLLPTRPAKDQKEFRAGLKLALQLLSIGRPGAALHLLDAMSSASPGDESLTQLVATAEKDFCEAMLAGDLRPTNVPARNRNPDPLGAQGLSSEETYLLGCVDGEQDFKTIIWLAPMRDVVALKAFGRLLQRGLIVVSGVLDTPVQST